MYRIRTSGADYSNGVACQIQAEDYRRQREFLEIVEEIVDYWNNRRRHSSPGQIEPMKYINRN